MDSNWTDLEDRGEPDEGGKLREKTADYTNGCVVKAFTHIHPTKGLVYAKWDADVYVDGRYVESLSSLFEHEIDNPSHSNNPLFKYKEMMGCGHIEMTLLEQEQREINDQMLCLKRKSALLTLKNHIAWTQTCNQFEEIVHISTMGSRHVVITSRDRREGEGHVTIMIDGVVTRKFTFANPCQAFLSECPEVITFPDFSFSWDWRREWSWDDKICNSAGTVRSKVLLLRVLSGGKILSYFVKRRNGCKLGPAGSCNSGGRCLAISNAWDGRSFVGGVEMVQGFSVPFTNDSQQAPDYVGVMFLSRLTNNDESPSARQIAVSPKMIDQLCCCATPPAKKQCSCPRDVCIIAVGTNSGVVVSNLYDVVVDHQQPILAIGWTTDGEHVISVSKTKVALSKVGFFRPERTVSFAKSRISDCHSSVRYWDVVKEPNKVVFVVNLEGQEVRLAEVGQGNDKIIIVTQDHHVRVGSVLSEPLIAWTDLTVPNAHLVSFATFNHDSSRVLFGFKNNSFIEMEIPSSSS